MVLQTTVPKHLWTRDIGACQVVCRDKHVDDQDKPPIDPKRFQVRNERPEEKDEAEAHAAGGRRGQEARGEAPLGQPERPLDEIGRYRHLPETQHKYCLDEIHCVDHVVEGGKGGREAREAHEEEAIVDVQPLSGLEAQNGP